MIYQYHHYNWASAGVANSTYYGLQITTNNLSTKDYRVPVLIGEFNVWADSHPDKVNATHKESSQTEEDAWAGVMELYCGLGWNFTTWNFKHAAEHSSWGLFNYDNTSLTNCITPYLASFNTNGNDNRSYSEIKASKNYYILTGKKSSQEE